MFLFNTTKQLKPRDPKLKFADEFSYPGGIFVASEPTLGPSPNIHLLTQKSEPIADLIFRRAKWEFLGSRGAKEPKSQNTLSYGTQNV